MIRIAIVGGGIAGLTAAYALESARLRGAEIDWHLYEASDRLGGIVETTRIGDYVLEGGPDGWVSEKPQARDLAIELGLKDELIFSNDATRKTWIYLDGALRAIPEGMRMMVPEDLSALDASPLFSAEAKKAYALELESSERLKAAAPAHDESVASFVRRHFGHEVLTKIAAPLLSGVFGGDVELLSVQAVMPAFVKMEREHGSLIAAVQSAKKARGDKPATPIFSSLRGGMATLTDALVAKLPAERIHLNNPAFSIKPEGKLWCLRYNTPSERGVPGKAKKHFKQLVLATPVDVTRKLLEARDPAAADLLPRDASSAVLVAFTWPAEAAKQMTVPGGFGFLVPPAPATEPRLLATTFVNHKFDSRCPPETNVIRAFFGSDSAERFAGASDAEVAQKALQQLRLTMGPLPEPENAVVRRWPRSLPQYEVGHVERMAELAERVAAQPGLHVIGNAYNGVGLPDLIREGRAVARKIVEA